MTLTLGLVTVLGLFVFGKKEEAYWDWQLTEPFDLSVNVRVLALDADSFSADQIADLRSRGIKPVCYVSIGTWEEWRPDAGAFPQAALGSPLGDWPGERYIDVRHPDVMPLMAKRFEKCKSLGYLAVEADSLGAYNNDTGLSYGRDDMLKYALQLHDIAAGLSLQMAQKNAPELVDDLVGAFDFAMVESCFRYEECDAFQPYLDAGKDVLVAEYVEAGLDWEKICETAQAAGYKLILKEREITAGGKSCN